MGGSLTRAYKVAAATLFVELILAFGLLSSSALVGISTIFAMVIVGVAWLPAALMIRSAVREGEGTLPAYLIGGACGITGAGCLLLVGKWLLLSLFVR